MTGGGEARYTLRMRGLSIGTARLDPASARGGVVEGELRPGAGWELVEPVFQLGATEDADRRARFERAREQLGLELVDDAGRPLPTRRVDLDARADGTIMLRAALL